MFCDYFITLILYVPLKTHWLVRTVLSLAAIGVSLASGWMLGYDRLLDAFERSIQGLAFGRVYSFYAWGLQAAILLSMQVYYFITL